MGSSGTKSVVYDKKSISRVHHISWNAGHNKERIIHHHFTNLKTAGDGFKIIETEKVLPHIQIDCCGKILKQNYSNFEPLFLPIKSTGDNAAFSTTSDDQEDVYVAPPKNNFAGHLYASAQWIYMSGVTPDVLLEGTAAVENLVEGGGRATREQMEIKELLELAKAITSNECNNGRLSEFPPKLHKYWAKKENKNWMRPSEDVNQKVQEMYKQGQGYKNRATRYTAEQAVSELREGFFLINRIKRL